MRKRILSTVLALCMVLAMLPGEVLAEESYSYQQEGMTFYFSNPYRDYGTITLSNGTTEYVSKLLSVPSGTTISVDSGYIWYKGYVLDVPAYSGADITFKSTRVGNTLLGRELEDEYVHRIFANKNMQSYDAGGFCVFTEENTDITSAPPNLVSATPVNDKAISGLCGTHPERPIWALDIDGKLSIKGSETIRDFSDLLLPPWYDSRTKIKSVDLSLYVTGIGSYAFWECGMESITIGPPVSYLSSIHSTAFLHCNNLNDIYYSGTKEQWSNISITGEPNQLILARPVTVHCSDGEFVLDKLDYEPHTHSYSTIVTPATCTEPGYTTYSCACGVTYQDDETQAKGHTFGSWEIIQAPTETGPGLQARSCIDCGYEESESIPWTDSSEHTHTYTPTVTPPTCTEPGYTTYTCTCGETYRDNETPATGHSYGPWEIVQNATETSEGLRRHSCSVCGNVESEAIPMLTPTSPANPTYPSTPVTPTKPSEPEEGKVPEAVNEPEQDITPEQPTGPESSIQPEQPVIPAPVYNDVAPAAWYNEAVNYASVHGLMTGTTTTEFSPESNMTRAMLWTVLGRLDGEDMTANSGTWYDKAQAWITAKGISDGSNPNGNITREELVTMLWRYKGSPAASIELGQFSDSEEVSGWASGAIQWAVSIGLLEGSNNKLNPSGSATRAEVATILMRFCESAAK